MNDYKDQSSELYQPCAGGTIYHSKADFQVQDTDESLVIKAPKSQIPQLIVACIMALGFMFTLNHFLPDPGFRVPFYALLLPMFLFAILIACILTHSNRKKGDWLRWDKITGEIDFPRLSQSDTIDNFVCIQMLRSYDIEEGTSDEVNCVFKEGDSFRRYPLFRTDDYTIASHVYNIANRFDIHVQSVFCSGKKPVVSGYQFESEPSPDNSV